MLQSLFRTPFRKSRVRPRRVRLMVEELGERIVPADFTGGAPPVAIADSFTGLDQGQIQVLSPGVLSNDSDPDSNPLTAWLQSGPANGSVNLAADGSFQFVPVPGFVGTDSFTYRAYNGSQYSDPATVTVSVDLAVAPVPQIQAEEGTPSAATLAGFTSNLSNPTAGDFTATVDWGDGTITNAEVVSTGGNNFAVQSNHTYVDDGLFNVKVTVTDREGNNTNITDNVNVANLPPVVSAGGDMTIHEGESVCLNGVYADPGVNDTHSFSWTVSSSNGQSITSGTGRTFTFTPSDDGIYTVTFSVTDNGGATGSANVTITVDNVPPTLVLTGPGEIDEGFTYSLNLASWDPGDDTIQYWTINWGDGSAAETVPADTTPTHVYAYALPGSVTISATATDEDGTWDAGNTVLLAINNLPPTVDVAITHGALRMVTLNGHVTDPAAQGLTVTFSGMVTGTATTDAAGYYTITAEATGLGQIFVSTVDAGGLASNVAVADVTSSPPVFVSLAAVAGDLDCYTISGQFQGESLTGMSVTLRGLRALANVPPVQVFSDGTFYYNWRHTDLTDCGWISVSVTDCWGQQTMLEMPGSLQQPRGWTRREMLRVGGLSLLGLNLLDPFLPLVYADCWTSKASREAASCGWPWWCVPGVVALSSEGIPCRY